GQPRHGYGVMTEHRARSGGRISMGNLYREMARLVEEDLVRTGVNPPNSDPRRIPYHITERGCQTFDQWFLTPVSEEGELWERLAFIDRAPGDRLAHFPDRWQEDLWTRSKMLTRSRDEALAQGHTAERFNALPGLLSRQLKRLTAELEFVKEFRLE